MDNERFDLFTRLIKALDLSAISNDQFKSLLAHFPPDFMMRLRLHVLGEPLGEPLVGRPTTSSDIVPKKKASLDRSTSIGERAMLYMSDGQVRDHKQVATATGNKIATVRVILDRLVKRGRLTRVGWGRFAVCTPLVVIPAPRPATPALPGLQDNRELKNPQVDLE